VKQKTLAAVLILLSVPISQANAVPVSLNEWLVNIDGTTSFVKPSSGPVDPVPTNVDVSLFDTTRGFGTVTFTITGTGSHFGGMYVDQEIGEEVNTFINEFGSTSGMAASGQSWEMDDPFAPPYEIYNHFLGSNNSTGSALDNTNNVATANLDPANLCCDVAMALGWDFILQDGETAIIDYVVSDSLINASPFYLTHSDPTNDQSFYYWSNLSIIPVSVPAPGTLLLMGLGFLVLGFQKRRTSDRL
jgi:hypothetical protein